MNTLKKFKIYMGRRNYFIVLSLLLSGMSSILGLVPYFLIWVIVSKFIGNDELLSGISISSIAWAAVSAAIISIIVYFLALALSHLTAFRVESNMRYIAMQRIVQMPMGFFKNNTVGSIRKIIDDNVSITHSFLAHQMPDLASTIVMPVIILLSIFAFNWQLGLVCLVPIAIAAASMMCMMKTDDQEFMKRYMNKLEDMNTEAVEYVRGIPVVKVFQQTIYSFKNFHRSITEYNELVKRYTATWRVPMNIYTVAVNGFAFLLVPLTVFFMTSGGNVGRMMVDFLLFILISPLFSQYLMKSMYMSNAIQQADEAISRLENLLSYEPLTESDHPIRPLHFDVEFSHVSFKYPGTDKFAADDICFKIPEGKRYALVGASGGGKSTIAKLLPRFWDAQKGEIKIGGIPVKDIAKKDMMSLTAIVFQNVRLFKTSILDNLRIAKSDATQDEINRALDAAQCREIIERLPDGINTVIGTEGTYLSDGEQQRIVLARAILKDAPIIIMDEATAFADPENEHLIQKALSELTKGKTVLMIAHRLNSVTDADRIMVVDKGRIVEEGTHTELLESGDIYVKMWNEFNKSIAWTMGK